MKLPFIDKFLPQKNDDEFFITLEIKQRTVEALLLQKQLSRLEALAQSEIALNKNVNHLSPEELIQFADQAISKIESAAPTGTFIKKSIFTVPYEWQDGGKVKRDHLATLKRLCDELELTPVGFLVPIEAIMHAMREQDGALSNAIFLELEDNMMTAYIARAGSIVEIERQSLEGGIGHTAEELLRRIKSFDVLPARIIVLRGTQSESLQQELVAREWSQDLPFLHPPQVSVMEKGFEKSAIIKGVAEQMKLNVAGVAAINSTDNIGTRADAQEFGFHKDTDIAEESLEEEGIDTTVPVTSDNIVINETQPDYSPQDEEEYQEDKKGFGLSLAPVLATLKAPFHATSGIPIGYKILPIAALVAVVGLVYAYYAAILKAEVVLYADEKKSEDDVPVVLSVSDDTSKDTIRISVSEVEVQGSESKQATGKKTTGEKASGEVTVFNKTEKEVKFSKGDALTSDSGKTFILADDVQIASTSAFSTSFSSKKVKVEAEDFGDDYNLEKNTNFTFDNQSQANFFAKNSDNFTGGTKKDVVVISEEDIANLEETLIAKLQKEAVKKAENDISSKETLIPRVLSASLDNAKFDKKAGDEGSKVNLSATAVFEIGYYEDNQISNFIKGVSTEVPQGYTFDEKGSRIEFEDVEVDEDGEVTAKAKVTAVHLPEIKPEELSQELARKTAGEAREIIESNDTTKRFEIVYGRKLPFMPELLPWNAGNIHVILKTESDQ